MKPGWLTLAALVVWTAAIVLSGCGPAPGQFDAAGLDPVEPQVDPAFAPLPGQAEFSRIAWEALGQTGQPPAIEWRRDFGCDGNPRAFRSVSGNCADGTYHLGAPYVTVADLPGARPWETAVAHEFQHFVEYRDLRAVDNEHIGRAFQKGGAVSMAETAMLIAGW